MGEAVLFILMLVVMWFAGLGIMVLIGRALHRRGYDKATPYSFDALEREKWENQRERGW